MGTARIVVSSMLVILAGCTAAPALPPANAPLSLGSCLPDLRAEVVDLTPPKDAAGLRRCGVPVNTEWKVAVDIRNVGCAAATGPIPWITGTNVGPFTPRDVQDACATVQTLAPGEACRVTWSDGSSSPWKIEYFFRVDPFDVIPESREGFSQAWFYTEVSGPWIGGIEPDSAQPLETVQLIGDFHADVNTVVLDGLRLSTKKGSRDGYDVLSFAVPVLAAGARTLHVEDECGTSLSKAFTVEATFCGGLQGLGCPETMTCQYGEACDPRHGGADCGGVCVPETPKSPKG